MYYYSLQQKYSSRDNIPFKRGCRNHGFNRDAWLQDTVICYLYSCCYKAIVLNMM
jgi:hypothetical protein